MPDQKTALCKKCQTKNQPPAMYCQTCGHILHPMKKRWRKAWRSCSLLIGIIMIILIVMAFFTSRSNSQTKKLELSISYPSEVKIGIPFAYTVTVTNKGDKTTPFIGIAITQSLVKQGRETAFILTQEQTTPPPYTNRDSRDKLIIYYPRYTLNPNQTLVFSIGLQALLPGGYQGKISALNALGSETEPKDISIKVSK